MSVGNSSLLVSNGLRVRVPGRVLVEQLDLTLDSGEFIAVLGRNGTGKTLSLLTLAGLRPPDAGKIRLGAQNIATMRRQLVARQLALLTQDTDDIFPATVMDTALIGRHPHLGRLSWESARDHEIAEAALRATGIADLAGRDVLSLSGGERRRLAIAQILTQAPDVYLLDEPTNHLDPQHQLDTLRISAALPTRAPESSRACTMSISQLDLRIAACCCSEMAAGNSDPRPRF